MYDVKIENRRAAVYEDGRFIQTIGDTDPVAAQATGNQVSVTGKDGTVELYEFPGAKFVRRY